MSRSVVSSLTSLVPIKITAWSAFGRVFSSSRWPGFRFILILAGSISFFFSLGVAGLGVADSALTFCNVLSHRFLVVAVVLGCCSHLLRSLCIDRLFRLSSSSYPSPSSFCLFPSWTGSIFPHQLGFWGLRLLRLLRLPAFCCFLQVGLCNLTSFSLSVFLLVRYCCCLVFCLWSGLSGAPIWSWLKPARSR